MFCCMNIHRELLTREKQLYGLLMLRIYMEFLESFTAFRDLPQECLESLTLFYEAAFF